MEAKSTTQTTREEAIASPRFQVSMKKGPRPTVPKVKESCPICMDVIGSTNCAKTSCGHSFCLSCIVKCLESNHICPLCREDIMEKKEATAGKKLKMDDAVRIIEDEMDTFGLHTQLSMARQFGLRALKTVVQSFALSTAHSIALMQDEGEADVSWDEIDDEEYASEDDASEDEDEDEDDADEASEADASEADEDEAEAEAEASEAEAESDDEANEIVDLCDAEADSDDEANEVVDLCEDEVEKNL